MFVKKQDLVWSFDMARARHHPFELSPAIITQGEYKTNYVIAHIYYFGNDLKFSFNNYELV